MQQEKNWTDYWNAEGKNGEVFVDAQGQKHPQLSTFWQDEFSELSAKSLVVDIASGAGSIYANLTHPDKYQLVATDISDVALRQLKQRYNNVQTYCCGSLQLPMESESVDFAVSQFGIEYAGLEAYVEAGRILKPGGKLTCLSHIQDGFIDAKNQLELSGAELLKQTNFVGLALKLTQLTSGQNSKETESTFAAFTQIEPIISERRSQMHSGLLVEVYDGFRKMFSNRHAYSDDAIIDWLSGMQGEIDKCILRLSEMRSAAISQAQVNELQILLTNAGMHDIDIAPFKLDGHSLPVAWCIKASKR